MPKVPDPIDPMLAELGCPSPFLADGTANADHYRWLIRKSAEAFAKGILGLADLPKNITPQHINGFFEKYAEINGVEKKHLLDSRTPEEKAIDAVDRLVKDGTPIFEMLDEEILAIELAMDRVDQMMAAEVNAKIDKAKERALAVKRTRDPKTWRSIFRRVRVLRERARQDAIRGRKIKGISVGLAPARTLRFMLYVGRSNISSNRASGNTIFQIGTHHIRMALGAWEAVTGADYTPEGVKTGVFHYEGVLLVAPPGHGKTELGSHFMAERYCRNPSRQVIFGHAQEDVAQNNLKYVRACFDQDHPQGRRCRTLYPKVRLARKGNTGSEIHMDTGDKVKQASGMAFGIKAAISGMDASDIWFDDCVDQKEIDQETERNRTYSRINGTWLRRLRGKDTFHITTTTLWHPDDANMRRIELARRGELAVKVVIQACGGPNSRPPFAALWPEMYDEAFLEARYKEMRDPVLYAATFMSDPRSESARIVRSLRYYNPDATEHREWLRHAKHYLSIDPAATNREKSDFAGIVHAAIGPLRVIDTERKTVKHLTILRILNMVEIRANQIELGDRIGPFVLQSRRKIDVLAETKAGFHAIADYIQSRFGIDVIRIDPGDKSKEKRLRAVSTMIDNSAAGSGIEAVVEFPGKSVGDEVIPDEKFYWAYDQILKFGVVPDDHVLDAVTQLVSHLQYQLSPGEGWKTTRMITGRTLIDHDRFASVLPSGTRCPQDDEAAFFSEQPWN